MTDFQNYKIATGLGFLFLGALTIGVFVPLSLAGITPLLGIIGVVLFYKSEKRIPEIDYPVLWCLLGLSALLISSSFWSITPAASLERAFKVSAVFLLSCPLLFLCRELPQRSLNILKKWSVLPLLLMAIILYVELKFSYPLYRMLKHIPADTHISPANLNKHVATLVLLAPFGIMFAIQSRVLTLPLLLSIGVGLVLSVTENNAAQLSAIIMLLSAPCLIVMPQAAPKLALSGLAFIILFMPWISPVAFDALAEPLSQKSALAQQANMSMRLENWDFLSRRIMENPWTGFGIDATRSMVFDTDQKYFHGNTIIHPHNIALQIWMEFGLIGVTATLFFLGFIYNRLKSLSLTTRIMPFAMLGGISIFLLVAWSCWASWLDGLILLILGLLILATRPKAAHATS